MLVEELIAVDEHDRIERVYDSRDVTQDRQQHTDPELNAAATMPEADAQGREQDGDEDFAEGRAPARHCDSLLCR